MPGETPEIIGRAQELRDVDDFLRAVEVGPATLVLEGEPGIGKTTLWAAGARGARELGYVVLSSRPAEVETKLSFSALGDLLADVPDEVLAELPLPQRRALEVALLLVEPEHGAHEERAVAAGFLSVLRFLATRGPVVVAIDDAQWLDPASASLLAFALRRIKAERVGALLAFRSGEGAGLPFDTAVGVESIVRHLELEPLGLASIHDIVFAKVGIEFGSPVLHRIVDASRGNPFLAVELARALARRGRPVEPGEALPVPVELRALVSDRLATLPDGTRDALLVAAALPKPTVPVLRAAMGRDSESLLVPAIEARVVEVDGDRITFLHPLLASAVYASALPAQRRELHGRLAALVADPEERARHLALSTEGADEAAARALDEAARRAYLRGAIHAAVELSERARWMTPRDGPDDYLRRATTEAEFRILAVDAWGARGLLEELVAGCPTGPSRADLLRRLADACRSGLDYQASVEYYEQALAEPVVEVIVRAHCEVGLAIGFQVLGMRAQQIHAHAQTAVELAEGLGEPSLLADGLAALALGELLLGYGVPTALIERACALVPARTRRPVATWPRQYAAYMLGLTDDFVAALAGYEESLRQAAEYGDEISQVWILARTSQLECLTGAWDDAARHVTAAAEILVPAREGANTAWVQATRALVEAHHGRVGAAREAAAAALAIAGRTNALLARRFAKWGLGLLELSLDEPAEAHAQLEPLVAEARAAGVREPGEMRFVPDDVEALAALGRFDEAVAVLDWFEECAVSADRASALATTARCRGLIAARHGDLDAGAVFLHDALDKHERVSMPFERARTLLALGSVERRSGARRAARDSLEQALAAFEQLGATIWAERARVELARIAGRAPGRGELTPAERRVAALVAEGRSNKEIAAELVITVRTVESTLTKAYGKAGVHSRTALANWLRSEDEAAKVQ